MILCFIGSSIEFVQNIYFVIMNTKFGSSYNCTYVIVSLNKTLEWQKPKAYGHFEFFDRPD